MNQAILKPMPIRTRWNKLPGVLAVLIGVVAIILIYLALKPAQPALPVITRAALEEQYGLQVKLVAVTAAGGLVDVRLKMLDGAKAQRLLGDKANFPTLVAGGVTLHPMQNYKDQEIKFEDNSSLIIMFSNAKNAVKPGTPVTIIFGNNALEAIPAQ